MIRKLLRPSALPLGIILPLAFGLAAAHADEVDDWYAAVCGNQDLIRWAAGIFGTTFAASLLANLRNRLPAGMAGVLDALALNFVKSLGATAQQAKKTAPLFLAVALSLALSACSGNPTQDAATAQGYVVAFQPLASEIACTAQAGANVAGEMAQGAGDASGAAVASAFSVANGLFCNGLPAGAKLPQPVTSPLPPVALGAAPAIVPK